MNFIAHSNLYQGIAENGLMLDELIGVFEKQFKLSTVFKTTDELSRLFAHTDDDDRIGDIEENATQ